MIDAGTTYGPVMKYLLAASAFLAASACATGRAPAHTPVTSPATLTIDRLPSGQAQGGDLRDPATINMIVIHTIGGPACTDGKIVFTTAPQSAAYWRDDFLKRTDASIHYVVDRNGMIAQQRDETRTAGHVSSEVDPSINRRSIGIEMTNNGDGKDPFPEAQLAAMETLVKDIARRHDLGPDALRTHAELDRREIECGGQKYPRRVDPGPLFPMERIKTAVRALH